MNPSSPARWRSVLRDDDGMSTVEYATSCLYYLSVAPRGQQDATRWTSARHAEVPGRSDTPTKLPT